jgi:hypothetical protein
MSVNHGGTGGRIPPEFAVGGRLYRLSPRFLSFFKIPSALHGFVPPPQISTQVYATEFNSHRSNVIQNVRFDVKLLFAAQMLMVFGLFHTKILCNINVIPKETSLDHIASLSH